MLTKIKSQYQYINLWSLINLSNEIQMYYKILVLTYNKRYLINRWYCQTNDKTRRGPSPKIVWDCCQKTADY